VSNVPAVCSAAEFQQFLQHDFGLRCVSGAVTPPASASSVT
jgi:hypothetical protein